MKTFNNKFYFKGFHDCRSFCHVEVWEKGDNQLVLVTEIASNTGTSVTNAIELILDQLAEEKIIDKNKAIDVFDKNEDSDAIDYVEIFYDNDGFSEPHWYPSNKESFSKEMEKYEN
jgi:hypothetical protein